MKNIFLKNKNQTSRGFTLVEIIVACAIMSLVSITLMTSATKGIELSDRALKQSQASMLLEEGVEATKSIRDNNWSEISSLSGNNYLSFNTSLWSLSSSNPVEIIDGIFTRTVQVSDVYRDNNDDISSTGTLDDDTKRINVIVEWPIHGGTSSKNITFYVTNIFN